MRILTRLPSRNNHPLPAALQRAEPVLAAIRLIGLCTAAFVAFSIMWVELNGGPRF